MGQATVKAAVSVAVGVAMLVLGACSSSVTAPKTLPSRAFVPSATAVTRISSRSIGRLGDVLTDETGRTVYLNSGEPANASACPKQCQRTWPLLLAPTVGLPAAGGGVRLTLLGRSSSGDLQLLTYAGHPLHEYVGDPNAGDAFGQGVQGIWSAVTVAGQPAAGSP